MLHGNMMKNLCRRWINATEFSEGTVNNISWNVTWLLLSSQSAPKHKIIFFIAQMNDFTLTKDVFTLENWFKSVGQVLQSVHKYLLFSVKMKLRKVQLKTEAGLGLRQLFFIWRHRQLFFQGFNIITLIRNNLY